LIITYSSFSQSMWKKAADKYKQNNIKEVKIYQTNVENKNQKRLWDWEFYDRDGRLIEKKRFKKNGKFESHYKFEYPNKKSRILISFDKKGNEIKRIDQEFDLSDDKNPLNQFSESGFFEYEYNENGGITKVWRIKDEPKRLQTENFYNEKGYLIKSKSLVFTSDRKTTFISTSTYDLDENVVYDPTEYGKYNFSYETKSELEKKEIKFQKKLSTRVISKNKAVCEGYSTLFKVICDNLDIKSKIVTGGSKTTLTDIGRRYYSNHAWNIVEIENGKYLIDVTWGAGTYRNGFEKNVDYYFYLTDPNQFIKKHYPDKYENSLLVEKIEKEDFLNGPLIYNNDIEVSKPINGIIKKDKVSNVKFSFKTDMEINTLTYVIGKENHRVDV